MLLITDQNGNVLAAWGGNYHSLASIYPNNPEAQAKYMEYQFEDDPEVLRNPTAYVVSGEPTGLYGYGLQVPTTEDLLADIRRKRDALLYQSDKTQILDFPISAEKKEEWKVYRQALRDFPETCDPSNPVWPVPPQ